MIAKTVKVVVDRPLGSYHPKHKDMYYPINYGFVEGIIAPDGEEQDAYILGVDVPVSFTKDEIMEQVGFQEKYFKFEIMM